jgi:Ca-activated chloride channel homolog
MLRNGRTASAFLSVLLLCCSMFASSDDATLAPTNNTPANRETATEAANRSPAPPAATLGSRPIRSDVEMVLLPVSVVDPVSDRLVTGLTKDNFEVLEDKEEQRVSQFSTEEAPISACIIFDLSGSMADKMEKSHLALGQFFKGNNPQDEFALISFGDRPQKISGFTNDADALLSKMAFAEAKGRTALLDAVYLGLDEMRNAKNSRKVMVIVSDGGDNHSRYSERDIRKAVKEADVQIYAIGIYETPENRARTPEELAGPTLLADLTGMTGGRELSIQSASDLPAAAQRINSDMRSVYILGYSPATGKRDGKWHKIQVRLRLPKNFPHLLSFTRSGYYAPQY